MVQIDTSQYRKNYQKSNECHPAATKKSPNMSRGEKYKLRAGDWVRVKSKEEILATLDAQGRLNGVPFMPEMLKYCGTRIQVLKRAHKTCDTVSGPSRGYRARRLVDSVHLNTRCDGSAHGGCQAHCLIFWNEAWLTGMDQAEAEPAKKSPASGVCTDKTLHDATTRPSVAGEDCYVCQATELPKYTEPLQWWNVRQYIEDYRSGNASGVDLISAAVYSAYYYGSFARHPRWGKAGRWLYDWFQKMRNGTPFPRRRGLVRSGAETPRQDLNLKAGEIVRVKDYAEILKTIDENNENRKMKYDAEMVPYSGKCFKVLSRVEKFIDEATGQMRTMRTPAVILEGAYCKGAYSDHRMLCPRGIYSWWREVWLERVDERDMPEGKL